MDNANDNSIPAAPRSYYHAFGDTPCKWCRTNTGGPLCSNTVCERCWLERAARKAAQPTDLVTVTF